MRLTDLWVHRAGIDGAIISCRNLIVFGISDGRMSVRAMGVVIVPGMGAEFRLGNQMHPAFWAIAGTVLPHLGVHRADIGGAVECGLVSVVVHLEFLSERVGVNLVLPLTGRSRPDTADRTALASTPAVPITLEGCGMVSVVTIRAAPADMMTSCAPSAKTAWIARQTGDPVPAASNRSTARAIVLPEDAMSSSITGVPW